MIAIFSDVLPFIRRWKGLVVLFSCAWYFWTKSNILCTYRNGGDSWIYFPFPIWSSSPHDLEQYTPELLVSEVGCLPLLFEIKCLILSAVTALMPFFSDKFSVGRNANTGLGAVAGRTYLSKLTLAAWSLRNSRPWSSHLLGGGEKLK